MFSRPRSVKERCTRSMEKPHMVSQDRDKEDDTSVSVASHAGVFRGAGREEIRAALKTPAWEASVSDI